MYIYFNSNTTIIEFQLENIIIINNENPFVLLHQNHSILSVPATLPSWRTIQMCSRNLWTFEYQSWSPRYQLWCLFNLIRIFSPQTILSQCELCYWYFHIIIVFLLVKNIKTDLWHINLEVGWDYRRLLSMQVDEVFGLMSNVGSEVSSDNAVPCWIEQKNIFVIFIILI